MESDSFVLPEGEDTMSASNAETAGGSVSTKQFCSFSVAERLFGVDILQVKEINSEMSITPVSHAPRQVKGYVNIRGQIHLVLDLRALLGFDGDRRAEGDASPDSRRLVIFKQSVGEHFAVLVDKIGDIVEVALDRIEALQRERTEGGGKFPDDLATGICKLENCLLTVLDARRFLKAITP